MYGIVQRGARGPHTVAYDFYPYLYGHGGGIFKDQSSGDYGVTLNSAEGREALDYYIRLAREAGRPKRQLQTRRKSSRPWLPATQPTS